MYNDRMNNQYTTIVFIDNFTVGLDTSPDGFRHDIWLPADEHRQQHYKFARNVHDYDI